MSALRVVSLCPSITETLVAIGGLPRLKGVTRYCTRPKGLLWGVPRIGGTKSPDLERIISLKPDLVFANAEDNRREDVEELRRAGVEVDVTLPKSVAEVPDAVRRWGRLLDSPDQAEALACRIETEAESLRGEALGRPFTYAYWIWKDPWMTVSDDTYVADLLAFAGGRNVYAREADRYPTTTPEEAIRRGADVHFFASEPYPFREAKHGTLLREAFGEQTRMLFVDGDDCCWHGYRTLEGLKAMRRLRETI